MRAGGNPYNALQQQPQQPLPPPQQQPHQGQHTQPQLEQNLTAGTSQSGTDADPLTGYDLILKKLDELNSNQLVTNTTISNLSGSLGEITQRVNSNAEHISGLQREMKDLKKKPTADIEKTVENAVKRQIAAADTVWQDKVNLLVNKKLGNLDKEMDKVKAIQAVQAQSNPRSTEAKAHQAAAAPSKVKENFENKFWLCRSSIRIWPISSDTEKDMWAGVSSFFFDKLSIPPSHLPQECVEEITRVRPGRRKRKIEDEVVVRFSSVQMRDMVVSYA